jgi:putative ABC transport system permease protein
MALLFTDLAYAVRLLGRNKAFTIIAIATLALGIGANAAIFTLVDTVVFRPLPYAEPERLVKIWDHSNSQPTDNVSWSDFNDIQAQADIFERVAADDAMNFDRVTREGSRLSADGAIVSPEWLATFGVQPMLGRSFALDEFEPGRDRVILLSHAFWQRLGGTPNVIGTTITIDAVPHTIIGVLPPNVLRYGNDFLAPLVSARYPRERSHRDLDVFARLKPGVTVAQAQAALDVIASRLAREYPATNAARGFSVAPLGKYYAAIGSHAEQGLLLMLAAVGLVLLIACANVTNLLLARMLTRSHECMIRAALGASRARLMRQMLVESVLLFLVGGTFGLVVARWAMGLLLAFSVSAGYVPARLAVTVDGRVLLFSLALSLVAGAISGIAPALQASRVDLSASLKASGLQRPRSRVRRVLIAAEIAISFVLLVGSGLMIRSFVRLMATPGGIDANNLLITASDGGREFLPAVNFWSTTLDRVRQIPGVEAAAVTSRPPLHGARKQAFSVETLAATGEPAGDILISADYFRTMGIPLLKGRAFTDHDGASAPPVAIISASLARRYFGDRDPIGRRVMLQEQQAAMTCCSTAGPVDRVWREIVGVAADVRQGNLDEAPAMTIYRPYSQIVEHDMFLMVRMKTTADATRGVGQLRDQLQTVDAGKQWASVRLMQDAIDRSESVRVRRFVLTLLASFASLALLLAAVGTYGVMAYAVAERTREIGIRVALGATRAAVLRDVLGDAIRLTLAGLLLGGVIAVYATRYLTSLLFAISAVDAATYAAAALVLAGVAMLASYVPARRAMQVDPLIALRHE